MKYSKRKSRRLFYKIYNNHKRVKCDELSLIGSRVFKSRRFYNSLHAYKERKLNYSFYCLFKLTPQSEYQCALRDEIRYLTIVYKKWKG
jgi:hypothetical protein